MDNNDTWSELEELSIESIEFQNAVNITNIKIATIASFYEDPIKAQSTLLELADKIYQRAKSSTDKESTTFTNAAIQYCLDNNLNIKNSDYLPIIHRIFSDPEHQDLTPEKLTELLLHPFILVEDDKYVERYGQKMPNAVLEGNIHDYINTIFRLPDKPKISEESAANERIMYFAQRLNATIGDNN